MNTNTQTTHQQQTLQTLRLKYENELFDRVIPFWERHSRDLQYGGFYTCLDRDGSRFDTKKYMWLNGRQTWMFSKLYNSVEQKPAWFEMARSGAEFLRTHARRKEDGRVWFCLTESGEPVSIQRKIFTECFYIMACAEYSRASGDPSFMDEAKELLEKVWDWSSDWSKVDKPSYAGQTPSQILAVPMILLNLIEEVAGDNREAYRTEVDTCIKNMLKHVHESDETVYELVAPDGSFINSPEGRVLNPGHAIEAGWFLQHWAQYHKNEELSKTAIQMVRWSYNRGWDQDFGGIFYFLDSMGFSPVALEWDMKLWWPHCEALVAHLLNFSITQDQRDLEAFLEVDAYAFKHFSDPEYGEWFGYLNRRGEVTHRFKGGPYKGCFHVPRSLWMVWELLKKLENRAQPA